MALPRSALREVPLTGHPKPRIGPPTPARHELAAFKQEAQAMGITLMPWQETAARYLTARGRNGLLYREIAIVVARQNGKTTLMKPHIVRALRAGKRITHIAQTRELPREMFGVIAAALEAEPELFPKRRGKTIWPRYGSGQEEIALENGGNYRIAASTRGGGRGWPNDIVIIDELREQHDFDVIGAAEPTLTMADEPQIVYLSNMGDSDSVVLNEVMERAGRDDSLAYLEWSAAPGRDPGDRTGWAEGNPALGHKPSVIATIESEYSKALLSPAKMAIFETERLCRKVPSLHAPVVDAAAFGACEGEVATPRRPAFAISMDASGTRASAAIAWRQPDDTTALRIVAEVSGSPIDTDALGPDLRQLALRLGSPEVGFAKWTDGALARYFKKSRRMDGSDFAEACLTFERLVLAGTLRWDDAQPVAADLPYTSRKAHESGAWVAVKAQDDRPVTAALAAIRAVGMASGPRPAAPRVL